MKLVDRLLIAAFVKAYLICLSSLLSLYIVVDLFTNLEDFAQTRKGLGSVVKHIVTYYSFRAPQIFDRLGEAVSLLAAVFTIAWVQRNNELLPLLSAGVSTRRVVQPVLVGACAFLSLGVLNQELVIPRIAAFLASPKDDPTNKNPILAGGGFEPNGVHLEGLIAVRQGMIIQKFYVAIPRTLGGNLLHLTAEEARYIPPGDGPYSGGWLLTKTNPEQLPGWGYPEILEMIDPGKFFLRTREVNFDTLTRNRNWFHFLPTLQLLAELDKPDPTRPAAMAVLFHMRLTRPLLGLILVFMGLSIILCDQNRHVFISAGLCLVVCAVFFVIILACKHLGDNQYLSPAVAAWLPVLFFGPAAFALFDCIHT